MDYFTSFAQTNRKFLVLSNDSQDLDEPWPIEVIGHDGKAHNVTMEPGDM